MNTKIIIVFGILLLIVEVSIIGFLVYLKNNAPSPEEQKKLTEDTCGPLAESGGGSDVLGLSTARNKASDAKIKASLSMLRAQAEIYFDEHDGYGSNTAQAERSLKICSLYNTVFDSNDAQSAFKTIADAERTCEPAERWVATCALGAASAFDDNSGFSSDATGMPLPVRAQSYAVSVPLKAGGSWCVDSTGASRMGKAEGGGSESARCSY